MSYILGADQLDRKLRQLSNDLPKPERIGSMLEGQMKRHVQSRAKLMAPVMAAGGGGELRQSIKTKHEVDPDGTVSAICYTNKAYAPYVEFGTGPVGAANHDGISPEVHVSYTMEPWWVHESQIEPRIAELYHWPHIDTEDGRFYRISGQAAQPFMYPAMKNSEATLKRTVKEAFAQLIREETK